MQIFIQHDGVQQGPYSPDTVRSLLREGSLLPSDPARYEDASEWTPLETLVGNRNDIVRVPRTSTLGVWSLFLGIFGIFGILGVMGIVGVGICSTAAIICGHLSRREIRKSGGMLAGKGNAMAGLVMGYTVPLLIIGGFIAGDAAITKAKKTTALAMAVGIESAVNNFYTEFGAMPS